jgi:hypothetical protein
MFLVFRSLNVCKLVHLLSLIQIFITYSSIFLFLMHIIYTIKQKYIQHSLSTLRDSLNSNSSCFQSLDILGVRQPLGSSYILSPDI